MRAFEVVLGLLIAVIALVTLAAKVRQPYPITLVLGGLALGFVPHLPRVEMRPDIVFAAFLPPLLYSDAWFTSWRDFRANLRPILLLAIGLVVTTTLAVAAVAHAVIPGLPWAAAFVLGAVVAPTDTVAAGQIIRRTRVADRIAVVVTGESMVNDATALVVYGLAVGAVTSGTFSLARAGLEFVQVSAGGIALGLAVAWLSAQAIRWLDVPAVENTVGLLTPFFAYLPAERFHVSGVLAVVAAGLYLGRRSARLLDAQTRLQAEDFWQMLTFLLNGLLFLLVGLQLHGLLVHLSNRPATVLVVEAVWVSLAVIVARIVWIFPATYLPRLLLRRMRERDPSPTWRYPAVLAWTGMRGALSLAAALAIPLTGAGGAPFPERDLLIFLTFGVILATLVVQGLTLPSLIRVLRVSGDGRAEREENRARLKAAQAASKRLEELAGEPWVPDDLAALLRRHYAVQTQRFCGRFDESNDGHDEDRARAYSRLKRELVTAEREAVIALRDRGVISDEVLGRVQHELDLEELRLE